MAPSVLAPQITSDKVCPGRNGFNGHIGDVKSQSDQLISLLIPDVNSNAAASPNPLPAHKIIPVIIRGRHAGTNTL